MRRYWVHPQSFQGALVSLTGEDFHHICIVCRQGLGNQFEVLTHGGEAHLVEIQSLEKKSALAKVLSTRFLPELPRPYIHMALSVSKLATMESVLAKSVELGVKSFHIFRSDFSNLKGNTKNLSSKKERLDKIVRGATQQSGRGSVMPLTLYDDLSVLLETVRDQQSAFGVFSYEGAGEQDLAECLASPRAKSAKDIWLFVGSEGGFSEKDVQLFSDSGMIPTTLGSQVLRVETACVSLVAVIKYSLGLFA